MIAKLISLPMIAALIIYKIFISPILSFFGVKCSHHPSCSSYAKLAISRHGPWFGGWMTLARLLRCQPWGTCGVDNVPENITTPPIYAPWRVAMWRGTNSE